MTPQEAVPAALQKIRPDDYLGVFCAQMYLRWQDGSEQVGRTGRSTKISAERNVNRFSVLHSLPTPHTAVVLFQASNIAVAARVSMRDLVADPIQRAFPGNIVSSYPLPPEI